MLLTADKDAAHPSGGHALLRFTGVPAALTGEIRLRVYQPAQKQWLGADGWQATEADFAVPRENVIRDGDRLTIRVGPKLVDRLKFGEGLSFEIVGAGTASLRWPRIAPSAQTTGRAREAVAPPPVEADSGTTVLARDIVGDGQKDDPTLLDKVVDTQRPPPIVSPPVEDAVTTDPQPPIDPGPGTTTTLSEPQQPIDPPTGPVVPGGRGRTLLLAGLALLTTAGAAGAGYYFYVHVPALEQEAAEREAARRQAERAATPPATPSPVAPTQQQLDERKRLEADKAIKAYRDAIKGVKQ